MPSFSCGADAVAQFPDVCAKAVNQAVSNEQTTGQSRVILMEQRYQMKIAEQEALRQREAQAHILCTARQEAFAEEALRNQRRIATAQQERSSMRLEDQSARFQRTMHHSALQIVALRSRLDRPCRDVDTQTEARPPAKLRRTCSTQTSPSVVRADAHRPAFDPLFVTPVKESTTRRGENGVSGAAISSGSSQRRVDPLAAYTASNPRRPGSDVLRGSKPCVPLTLARRREALRKAAHTPSTSRTASLWSTATGMQAMPQYGSIVEASPLDSPGGAKLARALSLVKRAGRTLGSMSS